MEILSLNNVSAYNRLVKCFETNRNKPWNEWLIFDKILDKPGKQGIVGLFRTKDTGEYILFKLSQYINYLVFHELIVMQGLKEISEYCPHFCKGIGMINCKVDAKYKKNTNNPFEINNKYPIEKDLLLCEYIENSNKFYNYIRSEKVPEEVLYSIVKQVLLSLCFAQKQKKFTHYDLHSFNIMIKRCDKDLVFLYKLDDENQFCVPTLGYYPVIIDFGFSYISDMDDGPLWASMCHTDVGFFSDRFDWVADPKLFLVTVSEEIKTKRRTKTSKRFRRIVKNIFYPLEIEWDSGWDDSNNKGASDAVLDLLEKYTKPSELFHKYDYYCIDIIQTLIILPLQTQNSDKLTNNFKIFLNEWVKIENELSNPFYNLYVLKGIVDLAREIRPDYMNKVHRIKAITHFRRGIFNLLESIAKFCNPKNIHYEKLLCSLYLLSQNIEGVLFETMKKRVHKKQKEQYDNLPLQSIEQIYAVITTNIQDVYKYTNKTKVLIMDSVLKECNIFNIPKGEIETINELSHLARGTYINDIYLKYKDNED